jgi:CBS domain-containing protein
VITVPAGSEVRTAVRLIMDQGIGGLPVVSAAGAVVGFIAERDIVAALHRKAAGVVGLTVDEIMRRPAPMCTGDDPLDQVMARMTRERLRHLVVLEDGALSGVISVGDLVRHRLEQLETEAGVLRDYVAAQRASR